MTGGHPSRLAIFSLLRGVARLTHRGPLVFRVPGFMCRNTANNRIISQTRELGLPD